MGGLTTVKKKHPPRIYFVDDDVASLWVKGETGDDLGPEYPGSSAHVLRLDKMDELVVLDDPYGRNLIRRMDDAQDVLDDELSGLEGEEDIPFEEEE